MGKKPVLVGALIVGSLVLHDGGCSSTVEEVDGNSLTVAVGGLEASVKVLYEVDGLAIGGLTLGVEDTLDGVERSWVGGVVTDAAEE